MEYTTGPNKVQHSTTKSAYNVVNTKLGGKYKIARCPYVDSDLNDKAEAEANAILFSQAGNMLEFIKTIAAIYQEGSFIHTKATDIITKATK